MQKTVKAAIFTRTRTALTRALSFVPMMRRRVTSREMAAAGRLKTPPPNGPAASAGGTMMPQTLQQPDEIARPAHRNRARTDCIFEDQRPADHPGEQLAHDRVGVGVGRARHRNHGCKLGIAKCRDRADEPGDDEADGHCRPGFLRSFGGQHENPGADHCTDAKQGQLERSKRTLQTLFLGGRKDRIERLHSAEKQAFSWCNSRHLSPLCKSNWFQP